MTIRIYTKTDHAPNTDWRNALIPMLKAYWGDGTNWNRDEIAYLRGVFELTNNIHQADIVALPMAWNYYDERRKIPLAQTLADRAAQAGKRILVWSEGDFGARLPFGNALLFQYDIRRSRRHDSQKNNYEYARTPFTRDYIAQQFGGQFDIRQKGAKPIIGFCGQARTDEPVKILARSVVRGLQARLGTFHFEPPAFKLYTEFRAGILRRLERSSDVQTDFIWRTGFSGKQSNQAQFLEFLDNIRRTDYTVCIRGWGNYSIRFCETLSMGRIPIFVDTDCALPYDFKLNWRDYCVWVDESELDHIAEKVADFHARISSSDFVALQHECRRVWRDYLTSETYFAQFHEHLQHAGIAITPEKD